MKQENAKKYIQALGLENAHNGLKRQEGNDVFKLDSEQEVVNVAYIILKSSIQKYGADYRATFYILRNDGTAQFLYNTYEGVNMILPTPIEKVKELAVEFSKDEDYMLMVEIEPKMFSLVTQV